ncbi:hypothetical protein Tco_1036116 [Tanacetum coccineum]
MHECRHWIDYYVNQGWWRCCGVGRSFDLLRDCMMVVKEIVNRLLEEVEKLEWWFEQDIDDEEEEYKEAWQSMVWMEEDAKVGLAKHGNDSLRM